MEKFLIKIISALAFFVLVAISNHPVVELAGALAGLAILGSLIFSD